MGESKPEIENTQSNPTPGVSDSLRDSSSVTSIAQPSRRHSGIYDVSRMTNACPSTDPSGPSDGSASPDALGRTKPKSELVRAVRVAIMGAIAVPVIAGAAYLVFIQKEIHVLALAPQNPSVGSKTDRSPAARATLPPAANAEIPATQNLDLGSLVVKSSALAASSAVHKAMPFKIDLDSNGIMTAPFAIELDENGIQVGCVKIEEHISQLPSLSLGEFTNAQDVSSTTPSNYAGLPPARPFAFTEGERRRITELRATAPEIKNIVLESETLALSRLQEPPTAITSLHDSTTEIRWMKAASFSRDISGTKAVEKRLMDSIMLLARSYKASGDAIQELPLLDVLYAYDQIRHLWRTADQIVIDDFFKHIVDRQFEKVKYQKNYDRAHATHVRFAVSVGFVTGNPGLQSYGLQQFKNHIESPTFSSNENYDQSNVQRLSELLHASIVIERANLLVYQNPNLNHAVEIFMSSNQAPAGLALETAAVAAYFRQDLYRLLPGSAQKAGISGTRFGTDEGAILAAIRKPTSSLTAITSRTPSAIPTKLPLKQAGK